MATGRTPCYVAPRPAPSGPRAGRLIQDAPSTSGEAQVRILAGAPASEGSAASPVGRALGLFERTP